jgi:hypothetical protein
MIGTSNHETNDFLAQMGSLIPDASVWPGESPGFCHWLRIPTPRGYVGVWDAEQLGEHGLCVQAYDLDPAGDTGGTDPFANVTYAGPVDWICERATVEAAVDTVRRYVDANATRLTRQSHIEQRQLQTHGQQPSLVSRHGCQVHPGQVT